MYLQGVSGTVSTFGATFCWDLCPNMYFKTLGDSKSNGSLEAIPVSNDLLRESMMQKMYVKPSRSIRHLTIMPEVQKPGHSFKSILILQKSQLY